MKTDNEIIESLIVGGVIGATLGAILSNNKEEGTAIGAIAGAAILATYRANEAAKKTNVPFIIEENNALYEVNPNGQKRFLRYIEKSTIKLEKHFKLI